MNTNLVLLSLHGGRPPPPDRATGQDPGLSGQRFGHSRLRLLGFVIFAVVVLLVAFVVVLVAVLADIF